MSRVSQCAAKVDCHLRPSLGQTLWVHWRTSKIFYVISDEGRRTVGRRKQRGPQSSEFNWGAVAHSPLAMLALVADS